MMNNDKFLFYRPNGNHIVMQMVANVLNVANVANGRKWSQMVAIGRKWSRNGYKWSQMSQIIISGRAWSQMVAIGRKWSKMVAKDRN